jgi:hypothetical protein
VTADPTAGTCLNTFVINCEKGSLKFTNDAGIGRYVLTIWQTAGKAVVVRPCAHIRQTNVLDIQVTGGAKTGDVADARPVTFQEEALARRSFEVRGDVRATRRSCGTSTARPTSIRCEQCSRRCYATFAATGSSPGRLHSASRGTSGSV